MMMKGDYEVAFLEIWLEQKLMYEIKLFYGSFILKAEFFLIAS